MSCQRRNQRHQQPNTGSHEQKNVKAEISALSQGIVEPVRRTLVAARPASTNGIIP